MSLFQCGLSLQCDGNTIKANWHEHWMCGTPEQIVPFSCTYDCPVDCDENYIGWPQNGADLVAQMCSNGTGGSGGSAGSAGSAGNAGAGGTPCPPIPSYPTDCSQVSYFQCGVSPSCEGNVAKMDWHEHYMCNGQEEIYPFTCTYQCAGTCDASSVGWPASGAAFVAEICQ